MLLAFANRIHPGFAEHQRQLARLSHQMRQVTAEIFFAMQIHVERNEIEKTQIEIFGRRIVRVGEERVGIDLFSEVTKLRKKIADRARSVPPHDIRSNLVADAVSRDCLAELTRVENGLANRLADFAHHIGRIEERHVERPRDAEHHAQAGLLRLLDHPRRRRHVETNHVGAEHSHQREIGGGAFGLRISFAAGIGSKRAVRNAANVELLRAVEKIFSVRYQPSHER